MQKEKIEYITKAINEFDLKESIRVYRSCDPDVLDMLKNSVGKIFRDDGFGSTSAISAKVASGNVRMEIDVPPGKGNGAWVNPISGAEDKEFEFLLQRGTLYKVDSMEQDGDDYVFHMKVQGHEFKEPSYATKEHVLDVWKKKGIPFDERTANEI
jgi:hypothetical protein